MIRKSVGLFALSLVVLATACKQESAADKIGGHLSGKAIALDIHDSLSTSNAIGKADLVLSMLPAHMHITGARECVR